MGKFWAKLTNTTEFQQRGSAHVHFLRWVSDAAKADKPENYDKVIKFVDSKILCSGDVDEQYRKLLNYQTHKHSKTCKNGSKQPRLFALLIPGCSRAKWDHVTRHCSATCRALLRRLAPLVTVVIASSPSHREVDLKPCSCLLACIINF